MADPHVMSRRTALAGGLVLPLAPRLAHALPGALAFAVFRNGTRIGEHHIVFSGEPDALSAATHVEMTVRLGPVPVFRYRHQALERRAGRTLARLETSTVTNGKAEHVVAEAAAGGIAVEGSAGRALLAAGANPLTHWNTRAFDGPLFHPQTGKPLKLRVTRSSPAQWSLRGDVEMDDTYDDSGAWLSARARADDGSTIEYRRL
jgi:hypothetical protein